MASERAWKKRLFAWLLAVAAGAFIAYVVPIRDRCVDPRVPRSTEVAVSRGAGGACVLHIASGDVTYPAGECAELKCEPGLASTLERVHAWMLAPLFAIYFAGSFAWALRWRMLLILAGVRTSLWGVWRVTLQAQAAGVLLPGGIGGDALRIAWMVGRGARSSIVVASVLLDRAIGLLTLASIAAALALSSGARAGSSVTQAALVLCAAPVGFAVGLAVLRSKYVAEHHLIDPEAHGLRGRVSRVAQPVLAYLGDPKAPKAIGLGILVSVFVTGIQLVVIRGLVGALGGAPTEESWVYVGAAMAFIIGIVPALPGGWGTADAAYVFFLGQAGLSRALTLGVSLLYRLFWYAMALGGAASYLAAGGRQKGAAEPPRSREPGGDEPARDAPARGDGAT
jgi:uncharacterized protein (TIRG00374 family)